MSRASSEDYYGLLGVTENVGDVELRRVWRQLAKRHHPDYAGDGATTSFQRISAAYAVLCDPVARANYDRGRRAAAREVKPAAGEQTGPARRRAPSVMLSRVSGPLMSLRACGIARLVAAGVIELLLNSAEAKQGGMVAIAMRVDVRCGKCAPGAARCAHCNGRGATSELFTAWLAVPPDVADGEMLSPSELLPGMVQRVRFVIRTRAGG